jgi:hypothetical protein
LFEPEQLELELSVTGEKSEKLDTQKRVGYDSQERQEDLPT